MRKTLIATTLTLATLAAAFLPQAAEASWLSFGTGFRVGPTHLSFVFGDGYGPNPYFVRFDRQIRYSGHHCNEYCFHEAGYYYHDRSCPVYLAHLRQYRVDPYWAFDHYAPRVTYRGYTRDHYRDYGRYDHRHDRYDRYDGRNGRYDGRHDRYDGRNGRYDGRYDGRSGRDRGGDRYERRDRGRDRYEGRQDRRGNRGGDRGDRGHGRDRGHGGRH